MKEDMNEKELASRLGELLHMDSKKKKKKL